MSDVIAKLLKGSELTEDAQKQIKDAFTTAVNEGVESKLAEEADSREAANEVKLQESIEVKIVELEEANETYINDTVIPSLDEKADKFITYVAKEWLEENQLIVNNGIKVQMAESFLAGTKQLIESYDLDVDSNVDKLEEATDIVESTKAKLDESLTKQSDLSEEVITLKRQIALTEATVSLTESQREKIKEGSQKLTFEDAKSFITKIKELIEGTFPPKKSDDDDDEEGEEKSKGKDEKKKVEESDGNAYMLKLQESLKTA